MLVLRSLKSHPRSFLRHLSTFDKYKSQLESKAREQGLSLPELLKNSQEKVDLLKKSETYDPLDLVAKSNQKKTSEPAKGSSVAHQAASAISEAAKSDKNSVQGLDTFVDVSKLQQHPKKEIEMIWKARFANQDHSFCGSLDAEPFSRLYVNAHRYPTFVLPLPHEQEGIELHYVQWNFAAPTTLHCLITSLAEYKLHQDYAAPHTTMLIHSDFVTEKGIALTNSIVQTNRIPLDMSVLLSLNLQRFYTADAASPHAANKLNLMRQFNTGDTAFSVDKLIEATETLD